MVNAVSESDEKFLESTLLCIGKAVSRNLSLDRKLGHDNVTTQESLSGLRTRFAIVHSQMQAYADHYRSINSGTKKAGAPDLTELPTSTGASLSSRIDVSSGSSMSTIRTLILNLHHSFCELLSAEFQRRGPSCISSLQAEDDLKDALFWANFPRKDSNYFASLELLSVVSKKSLDFIVELLFSPENEKAAATHFISFSLVSRVHSVDNNDPYILDLLQYFEDIIMVEVLCSVLQFFDNEAYSLSSKSIDVLMSVAFSKILNMKTLKKLGKNLSVFLHRRVIDGWSIVMCQISPIASERILKGISPLIYNDTLGEKVIASGFKLLRYIEMGSSTLKEYLTFFKSYWFDRPKGNTDIKNAMLETLEVISVD